MRRYQKLGRQQPADPLDMTGECTQSPFVKEMLEKGYEQVTIQQLFQRAKNRLFPREKGPTHKRQTRYTYSQGPMFYIGQQIVRAMQDAGYPAKISECYRPPDRQNQLMAEGFSKARAWSSPHQFYEAVDIIHPSKGWNVSADYWEALATCVRNIEAKLGVELSHGHYWAFVDSAHIQLLDWKVFKAQIVHRWTNETDAWHKRKREDPLSTESMPAPTPPTRKELNARFEEVLPQVWRTLSPTIKNKIMSET